MTNAQRSVPSSAVIELEKGDLIEAIKITRNAHGIGLREAKNFIIEYVRQHPDKFTGRNRKDRPVKADAVKFLNTVKAGGSALIQENPSTFWRWLLIFAAICAVGEFIRRM